MIIDSHEHVMLPTELQIEAMERAGVDRAVLFCTAPHPERAETLEELKYEMGALYQILSGANSLEDNMGRMAGNIQELAQILRTYPGKFYGFGSVPLGLSAEDTKAWIDRHIVANSLKGIGEFTPGSDGQIRELETVFQALEEFEPLPVWVHTFDPVSLNGIRILMDLTKKHPKIPVIFGHMGGYHWMEVVEFAKTVSNVYLDLSAAFSTLAVRSAVRELPLRCLYGSNAPYGEPLLSRQMIEYASPSGALIDQILGENILRLIG